MTNLRNVVEAGLSAWDAKFYRIKMQNDVLALMQNNFDIVHRLKEALGFLFRAHSVCLLPVPSYDWEEIGSLQRGAVKLEVEGRAMSTAEANRVMSQFLRGMQTANS